MSMNLHLENGGMFELWQTPSHITEMCMSRNEKQKPDGGMEGVKKRYISWVRSHGNGVYHSQQESDDQHQLINDHIRDLNEVKNPKFFEM